MSHNQLRAEKTQGHIKRPGRSGSFGQSRGVPGGGKGGGASAPSPTPPPSVPPPSTSASHEIPINYNNSVNGQVVEARANPGSSNSGEAHCTVPNGALTMTSSHGPPNGLQSSSSKPTDSLNSKKIPRAVPKPPVEPARSAVTTPVDESGPFLQFGTINPGIMNGMQIPARTCSAPPNLDEQKRHQASHDLVRVAPAAPLPLAPKPPQTLQQPPLPQKQHQTVKNIATNQIGNRESHQIREMHAPVTSTSTSTPVRSSVLNVGGMPMHVPVPVNFQQPQIPMQFRGPSLPMPSQGIVPSSLQMPMTLPTGNVSQVPQSMFLTNIQSHSLQAPTIMHQGQNLAFAPQLSHQLPPQLGINPQFHHQQPSNFGSQRKAVKITHPETHEELKLDKRTDIHGDTGSSGQRQLPSAASQSQAVPSFNHQISFYPTSYNNTSTMFFPSSVPPGGSQRGTGPQAARYSYPVGQNGQAISFVNPSIVNPVTGSRPGPPHSMHGLSESVNLEIPSVSTSLAASSVHVTVKPALSSEKVGTQSVRISKPITEPQSSKKSKMPMTVSVSAPLKDKDVSPLNTHMQKKSYEPFAPDSSSSTTDNPLSKVSSFLSIPVNKPETTSLAPTVVIATGVVEEKDESKMEALLMSDSLKDYQKRSSKKELKHSQQQTDSLEPIGNSVLHLPTEIPFSNILTATVEPSISNDSEGICSVPTDDSSTSVTSFHSVIRESETSELDQKEDTVILCSRASLDEEPLEAASSTLYVPVIVDGDIFSIEGACNLEVSTSSTDVDGIIMGTADLSLDTCKAMEFGSIELISTESNCDRDSNVELLGSSSTKLNSISASIVSSDEVALSVAIEAEKKASSQLGDNDDQQVGRLEDGGSQLDIVVTEVSNVPTTTFSISKDTKISPSEAVSITDADDDKIAATDSTIVNCETSHESVALSEPAISMLEISPILSDSALNQKHDVEAADITAAEMLSAPPGLREKPSLEPNRYNKTNKKKKRKENFSKADAAGSSDLYDAYKGPDGKLDAISAETMDISSPVNLNDKTIESQDDVYVAAGPDEQSKPEVEDWEDAADVSTPQLRSDTAHLLKKMSVGYANELSGKKKYSKDFLLTFSEQCKDLPEFFEIGPDITDTLLSLQAGRPHGNDRDSLPSPGRIIDRSPIASRGDRRMTGISDDDKRVKGSSHGVSSMNFRTAQGVSYGALRNSRVQSSNPLYGGLLSGPMQSLASQGGISRNNSDADRWQRTIGTQRGLMPPPQGSMQVMHKSANRYEVGKVSDEEEQKQRRLKAILNKLTPQNFEKLFTQVKEVNIDNTVTLTGVISQIFDKALMEPTFCEMYADFCFHLAADLPDFTEDGQKITFRRLLLNKCQEEFERGEREEAEADKVEEGESHESEAQREEKRILTKRRMLGNIRLIGELFKKKMLTERIMHECIKKLLGQFENLDEENIEALCKLMSTIGEMMDHSKARDHMDLYFDSMGRLSTDQKLSSRVRFMLKDTIDLRKNRWQQRRKVEGPKKIEDVHRDAAQERQAQTSRSSRVPINASKRGPPPADYGHRGSTMLNSSSSQLSGSIRALPGQNRGPGSQDVRLDERNQLESRVQSVPLLQRSSAGGSITLGPQGGLAKGMSGRGQGLMSNVPLAEITARNGDSRRSASGPYILNSTNDRMRPASREGSISKYVPDRSSGATNDHTSFQDHNSHLVDQSFDRFGVTMPGRRPGSSGGKVSISEPKNLSEDTLREKSKSAIREFYSAKDEKEIVLCIKDLKTPSYYPSMVSVWVSDSFERKNMERSLLAQLLVNLCRGHDSFIKQSQLIEGFDSVLASLEDAVNDAPKAAEFLGHIFGKVIIENLVSLNEIGTLILRGGEFPSSLIEAGLGSEIIGSIFEFIKIEKGDEALKEIRSGSNLRFEEFRPPYTSAKSKKLDAFL